MNRNKRMSMEAALERLNVPCTFSVNSWLSDEYIRGYRNATDSTASSTELSSMNYSDSFDETHSSINDIEDLSSIIDTSNSNSWVLHKQPRSSTPRKNKSKHRKSSMKIRKNLFNATYRIETNDESISQRPACIGSEHPEQSDSVIEMSSNSRLSSDVVSNIQSSSLSNNETVPSYSESNQSDDTMFMEKELHLLPITVNQTPKRSPSLFQRFKRFTRSEKKKVVTVS